VEICDNKLIVEKSSGSSNSFHELKTDDGIFFGFDFGEWGGGLFFFSNEDGITLDKLKFIKYTIFDFLGFYGSNKEKLIKKGNIKSIFNYNDNIYFLEGLAHLTLNEGALYELDISDKNNLNYKLISNLGSSPWVSAVYREKTGSLGGL